MTEIITHYVVVSDDAPEEAVHEAVRIKAKMLEADTNLHDIRVVRESELRQGKILNQTAGRAMSKNTTDREEWRNWLASHGLPHNEVEGELILDFIDGLISNREKLARIDELERLQTLGEIRIRSKQPGYPIGILDCSVRIEQLKETLPTLRKELDGGQSDGVQ